MFEQLKSLDDVSRRAFLEYTAKTMLGVSAFGASTLGGGSLLAQQPTPKAKPKSTPNKATADRVIYLFMTGAMSHLETFDCVGNRECEADTKPIKTKSTGMTLSQYLPELAKLSNEFALVRTLHTETGDHEQGKYLMRTSYPTIASIRHPGMGAWSMRLRGVRENRSLPDNVLIGGDNRHPGAGFLEPVYTPIPIGDPNRGLQNTKQPEYLTSGSFKSRLELIDRFDANFRRKFPQKQVEAYTDFYQQATALVQSSDLKAFDLNLEKKEDREKYGMDRFGQGCMLARRLIENDVRFVEVTFGNWDMHVDIYDRIGGLTANLDQAVSTLISDLKSRGLLQRTMVVLVSEFGRTPRINQNAGRDHHPGVFTGLLAGGGIKGGTVWGASDDKGHSPAKDACRIADFNATIGYGLGLPLDEEVYSKSGRPFKAAHDGEPVKKLFG